MRLLLSCLYVICSLVLFASLAVSETIGPIRTADDFVSSLSRAHEEDTFLFTGDIDFAEVPLSGLNFTFSSVGKKTAVLRNLCLADSSIRFKQIRIAGFLSVTGRSEIEFRDQAFVTGTDGTSGIVFQGSGLLTIGPDCSVAGGAGAPGIRIANNEGEFYAGIEGTIRGGDGETGGNALLISSLCGQGTVFLNGTLLGGRGKSVGGNALCLYDLNNEAFVSVDGSIQGGDGGIGGDGIQIVSARDHAFISVNGSSSGGTGESHGGNALMIVRAGGSSSVVVSGKLSGGNVVKKGGIGGHSLIIADKDRKSVV